VGKVKRLPIVLITILLVVLLLVSACQRRMIAAFGSNSEIVIVTSPRCAEEAAALRTILEREMLTVQYEKAFNVRVIASGEVKAEQNRKNIVLLDFLEPESSVSDRILDLAGASEEAFRQGKVNSKAVHERWAKGQVVMLVAAPKKDDLRQMLASDADAIFSFVSAEVQARLNRSLFDAGEQQALTQRLAAEHGWSLRLPTGYEVDESHASQRVMKIVKDRPGRMITVYWEGGAWSDPAATCLERKKMLAWEFWDQDEIIEETLEIQEGTFLGNEGTVVSGTWENKKYTIGGFYVTYCFGCENCRRNYLIDASVFAPGLEKLPLVRELKAVLSTFECCQ
jgi:hypothetical protein